MTLMFKFQLLPRMEGVSKLHYSYIYSPSLGNVKPVWGGRACALFWSWELCWWWCVV